MVAAGKTSRSMLRWIKSSPREKSVDDCDRLFQPAHREVGVQAPLSSEMAGGVEERRGVRTLRDSQREIVKGAAVSPTNLGDLGERSTGRGAGAAAEVEVGVEVDDADASAGFGCGMQARERPPGGLVAAAEDQRSMSRTVMAEEGIGEPLLCRFQIAVGADDVAGIVHRRFLVPREVREHRADRAWSVLRADAAADCGARPRRRRSRAGRFPGVNRLPAASPSGASAAARAVGLIDAAGPDAHVGSGHD